MSEKVIRVNTHPFGKPGPRRVDMVEKISQVSLLTQYCDGYSLYTLNLVLPAERQRKHYTKTSKTDHFLYIKFILGSEKLLGPQETQVNHVLNACRSEKTSLPGDKRATTK